MTVPAQGQTEQRLAQETEAARISRLFAQTGLRGPLTIREVTSLRWAHSSMPMSLLGIPPVRAPFSALA